MVSVNNSAITKEIGSEVLGSPYNSKRLKFGDTACSYARFDPMNGRHKQLGAAYHLVAVVKV